MHAFTEKDILSSFINVSLRERKAIVPPPGLADIDWDRLDYLGWRDPKLPLVAYLVADVDGRAVGIQLRQTEARGRTRPQCSWCEDVTLPNDVVMFSARRAGQAGRDGSTVGTLVCENFECSANVRKLPPLAYTGYDREAARQRRIDTLRERVTSFARDLAA